MTTTKKRQPNNKTDTGCDCVEQVNKSMEKYNTYIHREFLFSRAGAVRMAPLALPTRKIDSSKRGPAKTVFGIYCPICGKKYPQAIAPH